MVGNLGGYDGVRQRRFFFLFRILLMLEIRRTTWDAWNPVNSGKFTVSAGAGFLPATVWKQGSFIILYIYISIYRSRNVRNVCRFHAEEYAISPYKATARRLQWFGTDSDTRWNMSHIKAVIYIYILICIIFVLPIRVRFTVYNCIPKYPILYCSFKKYVRHHWHHLEVKCPISQLPYLKQQQQYL